jgi:hypothetical protein
MKGKKFDSDKERWDLLPLEPIAETVRVLTKGAKKYGANNWKDVENLQERYFAALLRHVVAWRQGQRNDSETGLHHLSHAMCCLLFIMWKEKHDTDIRTK